MPPPLALFYLFSYTSTNQALPCLVSDITKFRIIIIDIVIIIIIVHSEQSGCRLSYFFLHIYVMCIGAFSE